MIVDEARCPECGSWALRCVADAPVPGCTCNRCLRAEIERLKADLSNAHHTNCHDVVCNQEETAFRAGYRCWPDHGTAEDAAVAAWRARKEQTNAQD